MPDTMSRLTLPTSTIRATSRVSASVTRRPSRNSELDTQPLHEGSDLRTTAVDNHRPDTHRVHEYDVFGEPGGQVALSSMALAADLDHHHLSRRTAGCRAGSRSSTDRPAAPGREAGVRGACECRG